MAKFYANKAYGHAMGDSMDDENERPEGAGQEEDKDFDEQDSADTPDLHVKTHAGGHSLHVMHPDGTHEQEDFEHGDHDAVGEAVKRHLSGAHQDDEGQIGATELEPTTKRLNVNRPA